MTWLCRLLNEDPQGMVPRIAFDPILETLCLGLPPSDAHALREERAGILEFDAGSTRAEAERRAGLPTVAKAAPYKAKQ